MKELNLWYAHRDTHVPNMRTEISNELAMIILPPPYLYPFSFECKFSIISEQNLELISQMNI
jgi:hypothetical protein